MAIRPTAWETLTGSAASAEELFELLRVAGAITPRGRSNRSTVLALMTRTRDGCPVPFTVGCLPPGDSHTCIDVWDAVESALKHAGYFQVSGYLSGAQQYAAGADEKVQEIIDTVRGSQRPANATESWLYDQLRKIGAQRRETFELGPIPCPACKKREPDGALFCVWCSAPLAFRCSCSL